MAAMNPGWGSTSIAPGDSPGWTIHNNPEPYYVKKQGFQLFFSVKTNIFTFSPCNQPLSRG
jgi:hypothetical protein